jgi:predicted amidohydrolase YtcJ
MLADFVVLEQNPFETAPERLKDVKVFATYLGGEKVFG